MSANGLEGWAVDLKDIGAVYPMQGTEGILLLIGVVAWIAWHVWCVKWENRYHRDRIAQYGDSEKLKKAINSD